MNQCDGCNSKMPIINGLHYNDDGKIHMACTNGRQGIPQQKADIAERLRKVAMEMKDIAVAMDYYGGLAPWAQHSRELLGAADVCEEWVVEILAE